MTTHGMESMKQRAGYPEILRSLVSTPRECPTCGGTFMPKRPEARFCSRACAGRAQRKHHPKSCGHCGVIFKPYSATSTFCSPACQHRALTKHHPKPCAMCGAIFKPKLAETRFCSRACANRSRRSSEPYPDGGGYLMRRDPEHPMASKAGLIREHRRVMANHLGRVLLPTEHVHHLEVMTNAEHVRLHRREQRWRLDRDHPTTESTTTRGDDDDRN